MIKLVCGASRLKVDDQRFKNQGLCTQYDYYAKDARHIVMQCSSTLLRKEMTAAITERI